ncbi:MAG TPA: hypothetical protein VFU19_15990 [Iamia sp.]|nr:hypothetical protein [Iamia sp.]
MGALPHQIDPVVPTEVAAALAAVGRTEDLRFSPDGRRLAIAGFAHRTVVLVDLVVGEGPSVVITGAVVATTDLRQPHGLDWLDPATLVVGDRAGGLALLDAPPAGRGVRALDVATRPVATAPGLLQGPGSVAVAGRGEVLVAGNWADVVTRHHLAPGDPTTVVAEEVWLRHGLDLPDGVAVSPDGRWVAVSNHNEQVVLVHDGAEDADPDEHRPAGVLRGARYPHGLRFTGDGRLLVADAGSPVVLAYRPGPDGWRTAAYPDAAIRVLADETFAAGHRRPDEGGPKGIDVDPSGCVLAVTTEHRTLGFVDLGAALTAPAPPDPAALAAYERDVLARHVAARAEGHRRAHEALAAEVREHDARALAARTEEHLAAVEAAAAAARADAEDARRRAEAAEHRATDAEEHLAAIRATRLWRLADRPRRLYARLRRP